MYLPCQSTTHTHAHIHILTHNTQTLAHNTHTTHTTHNTHTTHTYRRLGCIPLPSIEASWPYHHDYNLSSASHLPPPATSMQKHDSPVHTTGPHPWQTHQEGSPINCAREPPHHQINGWGCSKWRRCTVKEGEYYCHNHGSSSSFRCKHALQGFLSGHNYSSLLSNFHGFLQTLSIDETSASLLSGKPWSC